ncbi:MAG: hypothetical protein U0325_25500 [Polyangiales bacterium]
MHVRFATLASVLLAASAGCSIQSNLEPVHVQGSVVAGAEVQGGVAVQQPGVVVQGGVSAQPRRA